MNQESSLGHRLQAAIHQAQALETHEDAQSTFRCLLKTLQVENPSTAALIEQLWKEYLASQRSSIFWQELSQVEKRLSDQLTASHVQLQRNYLRLVQEQ
jgi:hypothetical protein